MSVAVVVPFNPGDRHRDRNWAWLRSRWQHVHGWPIIEKGCDGAWSKGRAAAAAVEACDADVLVVADADVFCDVEVVERAVAAVAAGAPWAMPHRKVLRLDEASTVRLLLVESSRVVSPSLFTRHARQHPAPRGGGIVVVARTAWERSGGIDPRFEGWGGEDISWARALDTLAGPGNHLEGSLWHLWHTPQPRQPGNRASAASEALAGRYLDADGDPPAMRHLIEQAGRCTP